MRKKLSVNYTGEWRLVEGHETEMDALGHMNSILVVGHQEKETVGAVLEEEEEASIAGEEAAQGKLGKGDFEQTLEVSLNDTPADYNILHSEVSIQFSTFSCNWLGLLSKYYRPTLPLEYALTSQTTYSMHQ